MEPSACKQDRICTAVHIRVKHSVHHFPAGFTLFTNRVILKFRKQDPILYNTIFSLSFSTCCQFVWRFAMQLQALICKQDIPICSFLLSMLFVPPVSSQIYFCRRLTGLTEQSILLLLLSKDISWKVDFYKITGILLSTDNLSEMGSKFLS